MANILVVDDITENIQLLTFALEDDGHCVTAARNGRECLEHVKASLPDLILLDIMMPVMDGMEALRQLKSDGRHRNIPIIMASANDDQERVIQALDIGAHDFVSKPIIFPILAARIRSALRLRQAQQELTKANETLARLASIDPLTGVYNRRYYYERAEIEFKKSLRYHHPLSVLMLDADHFKSVNDQFGHHMGDSVLIELTRVCTRLTRGSDFMGRLGGEEFAICCPETDLAGAKLLAERIREAIHNCTVVNEDVKIKFTVSIGVAELTGNDENFDNIHERADQLLYQAKQLGRNRVIAGRLQ